jgi:hypothetical protein
MSSCTLGKTFSPSIENVPQLFASMKLIRNRLRPAAPAPHRNVHLVERLANDSPPFLGMGWTCDI